MTNERTNRTRRMAINPSLPEPRIIYLANRVESTPSVTTKGSILKTMGRFLYAGFAVGCFIYHGVTFPEYEIKRQAELEKKLEQKRIEPQEQRRLHSIEPVQEERSPEKKQEEKKKEERNRSFPGRSYGEAYCFVGAGIK